MTRSKKILGILAVVLLGIYGCTKPTSSSNNDKNLEAKIQRLEEDFRAATSAHDSFRQRAAAAEEQVAKLQRQLDTTRASAAQERDTLKAEVKIRTTERDHFQTQYGNFLKTLKEQLEKAESTMAPVTDPSLVGVGNVGSGPRN